ncbi:MAG: YhjD/YihY/BrkB family envelope integrity protein [Myxococcota bacterium]
MTADQGIRRLRRFLAEGLWTGDLRASRLGGWAIRLLQLAVMVGEGFVRDRALLRATALAYVTALSLIPALAIAVAIIGALGVREDVTDFLVAQIAAGSPGAAQWILRVVQEVNLGSLGTLGAALLFATTLVTIGNVERALNDIFGVRHQRTWARRIPDYLAVLVVAPLLVGVALSLGTVVRSQWIVQRLLEIESLQGVATGQAPILLLYAAAFTFLYWFLPNTRVRPLSALIGGIVAALLFNGAQASYVGFNVGVARYDALFGTLAVLPLFLVWIYISWAVVLLGAELAFAHQHLGNYRQEVRTGEARPAQREAIGLAVALAVAKAFERGDPGCTADRLSVELDVAVRLVRDVLIDLEVAGVVAPRGGDGGIQLGRPAETIRVGQVRTALRGSLDDLGQPGDVGRMAGEVSREIEAGIAQGPAGQTLADLLGPRARPAANGGASSQV